MDCENGSSQVIMSFYDTRWKYTWWSFANPYRRMIYGRSDHIAWHARLHRFCAAVFKFKFKETNRDVGPRFLTSTNRHFLFLDDTKTLDIRFDHKWDRDKAKPRFHHHCHSPSLQKNICQPSSVRCNFNSQGTSSTQFSSESCMQYAFYGPSQITNHRPAR